MVTFWTDADLVGHGEFVEAQVSLATEFTLPAGTISRFRWHFPAVAPSASPAIRLYNAAGALVASVPFDTGALDAWNWATPGAPISVAAGTYRATVTTTRYPALSGFFAAPITRGDITAVQGRFASGDVAPTSTSTAAYFVDVDFTAAAASAAQGSAGVGVDLAVAAGGGRASAGDAAPALMLAVAAQGLAPAVSAASGNAGLGVTLAVAAHGRAPGGGGSGRFPYGETVTVVRAGLTDDGYGNQVTDWATATSTPYEGCAVAQGSRTGGTEAVTGDRDVVISDLIVFMPSGADVVATDRLEVRSRVYEVVGEPFDWVNPFTGAAFGVVVYCNRVEG